MTIFGAILLTLIVVGLIVMLAGMVLDITPVVYVGFGAALTGLLTTLIVLLVSAWIAALT